MIDQLAGIVAAVGEEDAQLEVGGKGWELPQVDGEGCRLAVELAEYPLAVDKATVLGHAGEVVAHLHAQHLAYLAPLLEVEGFDIGRLVIAHDHKIAKTAYVGLQPTAGAPLDIAFDKAGGQSRSPVARKLANHQLLRLIADDYGHAEGPCAVGRIGALPRLDGVDGGDVAAVVLETMSEQVVVVKHASGHVDLIVATIHLQRLLGEEAIGAEAIRGVLGELVHGHEGLEAVADIDGADSPVAVVVGDAYGDAVERGVAIDKPDATVAKGAGRPGGVRREAPGDDVGLAGGDKVVPVELGIDGAGVGKGYLLYPILEKWNSIDPYIQALVAIVWGRALGAVRSPNAHIEAPQDGDGICLGAQGGARPVEGDLEGGRGAVEAGALVGRQQTDATDCGREGVADSHPVGQGVERLLGARVADFVVEVGTAAHAAIAGISNQLAAPDRQHPFGEGGVEGVALVHTLEVEHVGSNVAMVAVEVQVDCGNIATVIDIKHLATIVCRNAEAADIAIGGGVDGLSHTIAAAYAQIEAAMEVVGTGLGKGAGRLGRAVQREVEFGRLEGLRLGLEERTDEGGQQEPK